MLIEAPYRLPERHSVLPNYYSGETIGLAPLPIDVGSRIELLWNEFTIGKNTPRGNLPENTNTVIDARYIEVENPLLPRYRGQLVSYMGKYIELDEGEALEFFDENGIAYILDKGHNTRTATPENKTIRQDFFPPGEEINIEKLLNIFDIPILNEAPPPYLFLH